MRTDDEIRAAAEALREVGTRARVYLSMPVIEGVTPRALVEGDGNLTDDPGGLPRKDGIFRLDEVGLSPMDHVALYGDAAFEGILIRNHSIFLYREHMERMERSLEKIAIEMPMDRVTLTQRMLETAQQVNLPEGNGYIRLVVTRGMGDLGINPKKCVSPTVFMIVSTIRLYAREAYERGIPLGLSRQIRRPNRSVLDPNIKSNNYLNNVMALQEGTRGRNLAESLMLTDRGYVAEATVDNIFSVVRTPGWESDPSRVEIQTPSSEYCLPGITRETVIQLAQKRGYKVIVRDDMLPLDLVGPDRECFMTGTGAGVMPITAISHVNVGDGKPGPVTAGLIDDINAAMADPANGLSVKTPLDAVAEALGEAAVRS
ncbi:MAG: branched-chain amino acid aminotransferase [Gemmatimonadetes bacterium]|nr:branched-chain amino acid aminotransferase [Gemmatimonadota bacterium]